MEERRQTAKRKGQDGRVNTEDRRHQIEEIHQTEDGRHMREERDRRYKT